MKIAMISFTKRGTVLEKSIGSALNCENLYVTARLAEECGLPGAAQLNAWTGEQFARMDALIFVGATGIAVRAIAPFVADKFRDPAVVSVDEAGRFVVPLLSGHVGGANALARRVADITGGTAVISTATDVNDCFAVDVWAKEQELVLTEREAAKAVSAALLEGKKVGFLSEVSLECPKGILGDSGSELGVFVTYHKNQRAFSTTLSLYPPALVVGIGCRRDTPAEVLRRRVEAVLQDSGLAVESVAKVASIDLKQDEKGLHALAKYLNADTVFYTAEQLREAAGEFSPSAFVQQVTGVDNVCERAAVLAAESGSLLVKKQAGEGVTVAVALIKRWERKDAQ